ncbi:unnamed protein product [Pelagomonas calceolata]|uniref:Uncharacterized protein n=1 Tax=Pelagomonas calceolata TaxID=35677 RepID=A0A8J2T2E0_9STRA|nr:unnamed protein product [Pelagomonas calceolata]
MLIYLKSPPGRGLPQYQHITYSPKSLAITSRHVQMADPIDTKNRELMDYLFEKKEEVPNEIYVTLTNIVKKKQTTSNKYFKVKYSLTEAIAVAHGGGDDEDMEITMKYKTKSREGILRQLKSGERVDRSIFDDILDGYAPMDITAFRDATGVVGATFVKTEWLLDNVSYTIGKLSPK